LPGGCPAGRRPQLRRSAVYWLFRAAVACSRRLPLRLSYDLAAAAGTCVFVAWPGGRRRCIDNMRHVLGGDARAARRAARRSFANYARYLVDFLRFTAVTPAEVRARVHFAGWPALEAARNGRGIVFVTLHFGNWDLGAAALADHGFPISVVADTFGDERLNDRVLRARSHLGMQIIPAQRMGPSILRALHRNDVVALLIDVPQPGSGVEVEFFGAPIAVADGPARIALRAGASVVAATLPRVDPRSDRVVPDVARVDFVPTGDQERDVRALTQAMFSALEPMVRRHPDQWYIFRRLWLTGGVTRPAC
jgi:KDO2-lipid IV(A) lauroyltransferase